MTKHREKKAESKKQPLDLPAIIQAEVALGIPIDRSYAWVIAFCGFVIHIIFGYNMRTLGILCVEYMDLFEVTPGQVSIIQTMVSTSFLFSSPVVSILEARLNPRVLTMVGGCMLCAAHICATQSFSFTFLCVTFGPLLGMGCSIVHLVSITFTNKFFFHRRGLANGLMFTGIAVGSFVGALLVRHVVDTYSIRNAQLLLAGINLHVCVMAAFMRPKEYFISSKAAKCRKDGMPFIQKPQESTNPETTTDSKNQDKSTQWKAEVLSHLRPFVTLLRDPWFLLYALGATLSGQALLMSFFLIPMVGQEIGLSRRDISWILFFQGIPDIASRFVIGVFADMSCLNLAYFSAMLLIGQGSAYLVYPLFPSWQWGMVAFAVIVSIFSGANVTLRMVVATHLMDRILLSPLLGITMLAQGVVWGLLPRFFGYLRDVSGSWRSTFIVVTVMSFSSAVIMALLSIRLKQRKKMELADNKGNAKLKVTMESAEDNTIDIEQTKGESRTSRSQL